LALDILCVTYFLTSITTPDPQTSDRAYASDTESRYTNRHLLTFIATKNLNRLANILKLGLGSFSFLFSQFKFLSYCVFRADAFQLSLLLCELHVF